MTIPAFRTEAPPSKKLASKIDIETGDSDDDDEGYRDYSILDVVKERWGWLVFFFVGLLFAAWVVESFEDILEKNVQLSFFVPLLMGHGGNTGALLGAFILGASFILPGLDSEVGAVVAIALPVVSLWSNGLGACLTMLADKYKFNPAVTSVPLLTTIVDSTGLVIYFYIAKLLLGLVGK